MARPRAEREYVARLKQHQSHLNRLMRNENLHPSRGTVVEMVSLLLDCKDETIRNFMMDLIRSQFITPRANRWREDDEPAQPVPGKDELEAGHATRQALADFLKEK